MRRWLMLVPCAMLLGGCVSVEQKRSAIEEVNTVFRECYERTISARGRRHYALPRTDAIRTAQIALETLGMTVVRLDPKSRYVRARAPAPAPLSDDEWQQAVDKDGPMLRRIIADEVGLLGYFVQFEPQGLDIVITITGVDAGNGTDLSATMRMVERTPPPSGWPRREYPPCEALATGVDKLWRTVDDLI